MTNEVKLKLAIEGGQIVSAEIDGVNRRLTDMDRSASLASVSIKAFSGAFGGMSAAMTVGKLISVQREFDVLNSSLITVTGSSTRAAQEFAWIKQFAATTPYQLNEVTGAFVKMKSLGLDASQKALTSYGNTASAMGKNLNQMIEAVADASTGEFERLKEFGIKASKQGDQVSLTFQGATTTIGNSAKEITGYLESIGNVNFAGAMEERAKTLDGALSNLADNVDELFRTLNQGGVGEALGNDVRTINTALQGLNDTMLNSQKAGDSMVMQLANGAGFAIGTAAVGTLNSAFNGFNWTVNALTGNLLHLNENVKLLPENLMTNEQRAVSLGKKLQDAGADLANLQARLALNPDNIYLKSETYQAYLLTIQLKAAKEAQDKLTKAPQTSQSESRIKASNAYAEEQAAAQKKIDDLLAKSSGVSDAYIKRAKEIAEANKDGKMSVDELAIAWSSAHDLLKKDTAGIAAHKKELTEAAKALEFYNDLMDQASGYSKTYAEDQNKLALSFRNGGIKSYEDYAAAVQKLVGQQPGMKALADAEQKEAQAAAKRWGEGYAKQIAEEEKSYRKLADAIDSVDKSINAMLRENNAMQASNELDLSLMGQTAEARAKAIEQQQVLNKYIEEERKARETITDPAVLTSKLDLINTQKLRAVDLAAQKQSIADWNRTNDRISDGLVSALTKGGKEGAQQVRDLLVQELFSKPFQMVIQALVSPVANAVAGAATSMTGSALSSAGGSMLGNAASMASLGASAGSAFGAGAASWFTNGIAGTIDLMTTATGSLLADASFALGAVAAPLAIALAAYSIFGQDPGGPKSTAAYGPNVTSVPDADTSATSAAANIAKSIESTWNTMAEGLGLYTDHLKIGILTQFDPYGTSASVAELHATRNGATVFGTGSENIGRSDAEMQAYLTEQTTRLLYTALTTSDLPQQYLDYLQTMGGSVADMATGMENVFIIHDFQAALENLPFEYLAGLSFNAAKGLIEAAGGLSKLDASLAGYYTNFYTETEKTAQLTTNTAKAFTDLGLVMPTVDEALRANYRAEVERLGALDLSVEANAKAYAGAVALQGSVSTLATTFDAAADKMAKALASLQSEVDKYNLNAGTATDITIAQSATDRAWAKVIEKLPGVSGISQVDAAHWLATASAEMLTTVAGAAMPEVTAFLAAFNSLTSATTAAAQTTIDAAQALQDSFSAAGKGIYDFVQDLIRSTATTDQLWATYKTDLVLAQAGDLSASERITTSAQAYLEKQRAGASTTAEAALATARMVSELSALPAAQSYEQEMVNQLKIIAQNTGTTALAVVTTAAGGAGESLGTSYGFGTTPTLTGSTGSTSTASSGLMALLAQQGMTIADMTQAQIDSYLNWGFFAFDKGTNYLPEDMLAQVHKGERIIPAADNTLLMQRLQSPQGNNDVLVAEIRALRAEVSELRKSNSAENVAIAGNTKNAARRLETFEADGIAVRNDATKPFTVEISA